MNNDFNKCPVCGLTSSMPYNAKVLTPVCRVLQTGTVHPNGDVTTEPVPDNCPNVVRDEPPLLTFAKMVDKIENPKDEFKCMGETFVEGDKVYGSWVDSTGKSYFTEGTVVKHPAGLFVDSGGITAIKMFHHLRHSE